MRKSSKRPLGLISKKPSNKRLRCDRCEVLLIHSITNGKFVIFSSSRSPIDGFYCVRCITIPSKNHKTRVTMQQVDAFLQQTPVLTPPLT